MCYSLYSYTPYDKYSYTPSVQHKRDCWTEDLPECFEINTKNSEHGLHSTWDYLLSNELSKWITQSMELYTIANIGIENTLEVANLYSIAALGFSWGWVCLSYFK